MIIDCDCPLCRMQDNSADFTNFWLECAVSGVGHTYACETIDDAVRYAKSILRNPNWSISIWIGSTRVAKVFLNHEWVASPEAIEKAKLGETTK